MLIVQSAAVSTFAYVVAVEYPTGGEGNTSTTQPFSFTAPVRYQQVYEANRFNALPSGGGTLQSINFRLDTPLGRNSSGAYDSARITVSTTSASEGSLSPVFMQNMGVDARVVFAGSMTLVALYSRGSEPQSFDLRINLTTPFLYDPARGNLLFEYNGQLLTPGPNGFGPLDAFDLQGDGMASVFAVDGGAASGEMTTRGLTTLFIFDAVPEPSAFALLAIPAVLAAVVYRRRTRSCR